jgi:phage shock protein A
MSWSGGCDPIIEENEQLKAHIRELEKQLQAVRQQYEQVADYSTAQDQRYYREEQEAIDRYRNQDL